MMATQETKQLSGRVIGTVTRIDGTRQRGFGFIKDGGNNEYFLHRTSCTPNSLFDDLREGDPVSIRVTDTPKGQKAFDLRRATDEETATITEHEEFRGNR